MFYGTTGSDTIFPNQSISFKLGALFGVMDCFSDQKPKDGIYKAVIGTWQIVERKNLKLYTVINPYPENNKATLNKIMAKNFDAMLEYNENRGLVTKLEGYQIQSFFYKQFNKEISNSKEYIVPAYIFGADSIYSPNSYSLRYLLCSQLVLNKTAH